MRLKLTATTIKEKCLPPNGETNGNGKPINQKLYFDTQLPGFALLVGRTTKTFVVQKSVDGRTKRITIGQCPPWDEKKARLKANQLLMGLQDGIVPPKREAGVTLGEALELHVRNMRKKECSPRSLVSLELARKNHLAKWLNRPLKEITPDDCAKLHDRLTEDSGPYSANRVLAILRAAYNSARKRNRDLPENPVFGVTFNKVKRRREPISLEKLPDWYEKVQAISNPIVRDLHLFILFTGLRRDDAKTVRWEHIDFEAGTIHRPKPKGGEDRAFIVPLPAHLLSLLRHRRDENEILYPGSPWAFPSPGHQGTGEVVHVRDPRREGLPSAHRLRDTFASAAHEAGVSLWDIKVLMNHTLPANGDVTLGYIRPSMPHLRECVEKIASFLLSKIKEATAASTPQESSTQKVSAQVP